MNKVKTVMGIRDELLLFPKSNSDQIMYKQCPVYEASSVCPSDPSLALNELHELALFICKLIKRTYDIYTVVRR